MEYIDRSRTRPALMRTGVGIVGCGNVFGRYVTGLARYGGIELIGCADVSPERAHASAQSAGIAFFERVADLLEDPRISIVVNLTPPNAHFDVGMAVLRAGKHLYSEKPLALTLQDSAALLGYARDRGLLVGASPDTFLGAAAQTARATIDSGTIGRPIGATAFLRYARVETWHPDPTFLFQPGGGPLLDMGPYYLTALVNCLGPVESVAGMTHRGNAQRVITSPRRRIATIDVNIDTHAAAVLRFACGAVGLLQMSFDVWNSQLPFMEIYGTQGTLALPDPNGFDGTVSLRRNTDGEWQTLVAAADGHHRAAQLMRGPGVADLASALQGAEHRANGAVAHHVLEALLAVEQSSRERTVVAMRTGCDRPAPLATAQA